MSTGMTGARGMDLFTFIAPFRQRWSGWIGVAWCRRRGTGGLRMGIVKVNGSVRMIVGVDPATAFQLFDVKPLQGQTSDLGPNSIAAYKNVARDKHLHLGDSVPVVFKDTGLKQLRVALIYGEKRPAGD